MFVSKLPIKLKKSISISVGKEAVEFNTHSYPCLVTVADGNAYLLGSENEINTIDSAYPMIFGQQFELCGAFKLISDNYGADVRIMYYDHV